MRRKFLVVVFWLCVWQLLAMAVDNPILLATPAKTFAELWNLSRQASFWRVVFMSLGRIGLGFVSGFAAAVLLAVGARCCSPVEELLRVPMNLIKSVPVASFAVILLIWRGPSFLSVAICFLVVLPNLYISTLEGLRNTDGKLLEAATVFRMPFVTRLFYLYLPSLRPFLLSSLKISLGMCWKSGVAAEVIGTPDYSIGERLYLSKIYLDTAGVFAWTAVVIVLSILFEKMVLLAVDRFFLLQPRGRAPKGSRGVRTQESRGGFRLNGVCKSYGETQVIRNLSVTYAPGESVFLTGPSGSGKTTLLRLLSGLERADGGSIEGCVRVSLLFQEDRLFEQCSAAKNVELVTGNAQTARKALEQVLPADALDRPMRELSGGMKRRVALVRAMEADSEAVLLDEPFAGLDEETITRVSTYIRKRQAGRTLLIATHIQPKQKRE